MTRPLPLALVAVAAAAMCLSACAAQRPSTDPSVSVSAVPPSVTAPGGSGPGLPSETPTEAASTSVAPVPPSSATPSEIAPPIPSTGSASPSSGTAAAVALPDRFGLWMKVEQRVDGPWTIAAYTNVTSAAVVQVQVSTNPGGTFEQVASKLLGDNQHQTPTGALCSSRAKFAGCAQQQDRTTAAVTSVSLTEAQVADVLGQLLVEIR